MKFNELIGAFNALDFPLQDEARRPDRAAVLSARTLMEAALADDEFLLDCIELELRLIAAGTVRAGLVPFFTIPATGIHFAMGYWPPGKGPGPHEHTAWTITGVLRNTLEVQTYDRDESYRRGELIEKNLFSAAAGTVGYMYEPGIHAPRNPSSSAWALSIHVISPRDGQPMADFDKTPAALLPKVSTHVCDQDGAYASVMMARRNQRWVRELASTLAASSSTSAAGLLAACFELGSANTRDHIRRVAPANLGLERAPPTSFVLKRVHENLVLRHASTPAGAALAVQTRDGFVNELFFKDSACDAIKYAARHRQFDVQALPGRLNPAERTAVGQALEETGFFSRVYP